MSAGGKRLATVVQWSGGKRLKTVERWSGGKRLKTEKTIKTVENGEQRQH